MRSLSLLALCALVLSLPAYADAPKGYWIDKNGNVLKTAKGFCIRTGKWSEKTADRACLDAMKKNSSMAMSRK
jgi:hypothetical protein